MAAGTYVFLPIWNIQRDPLNWGPDADAFRPDRFDETDHSGRWLPFSGGARNCIGQVCTGAWVCSVWCIKRGDKVGRKLDVVLDTCVSVWGEGGAKDPKE